MAPRKPPAPSAARTARRAPAKPAPTPKPAQAQDAPRPGLVQRTSLAEWIAAGLGLVLTLVVIGYLLFEGLRAQDGPPDLVVDHDPAKRTEGGWVLPITVRNGGETTAASVEVRGTLTRAGAAPEDRTATFAYVPGGGEAKGGLIFQTDPAQGTLEIVAEAYEEP